MALIKPENLTTGFTVNYDRIQEVKILRTPHREVSVVIEQYKDSATREAGLNPASLKMVSIRTPSVIDRLIAQIYEELKKTPEYLEAIDG